MMTEEERGKEFPIHIEMDEDGPVLDLGSRAGALNLPKTGCILVDYVLNEDGTLQVKTICMQAAGEGDDDEPDDLDDALDRAAKKPKQSDDDYEEDE